MLRAHILWPLLAMAACHQDGPPAEADAGAGYDLAPAADAGQPPATKLVLVGGGGLGSARAEILGRVVQLAGGKGAARIGVITAGALPERLDPGAGTASAYNAKANGAYYVKALSDLGAAAEWIPLDLDLQANNSAPAVVARVQKMTGFMFGSGSQSRLLQCLTLTGQKDSPLLAALRRRFEQGAVVAGTSAGAAVMASGAMITGGESYEALLYGAKTAALRAVSWTLTYNPKGGLGLFSAGLIDTHTSGRGRQGRLLRLALDRGASAAYGLDETTALVAVQGQDMQVLGARGVWVFDLTGAKVSPAAGLAITGVRASYLSRGDRFAPATGALAPPAWKTPLQGREWYKSPLSQPADIFSSPRNLNAGKRKNPLELTRLATRLVDHQTARTAAGTTHETGPAYRVTLTRGKQTIGHQGKLNGTNHYSFTGLELTITEQK